MIKKNKIKAFDVNMYVGDVWQSALGVNREIIEIISSCGIKQNIRTKIVSNVTQCGLEEEILSPKFTETFNFLVSRD